MHFDKLELHKNFKWDLIRDAVLEGRHDMPVLKPADAIPHDLVCFHLANTVKDPGDRWFHFYEDDYQFERVWNRPDRYLPVLRRFEGGIGPDFSIYLDMPEAQQIWNCWRNRALTYWMQSNGLEVVPSVVWGNYGTFEWAFDGLPENSVLSITTQGCMRDGVCKHYLVDGIHELVTAKHPTALIVYGAFPERWKERFPVRVITYPTFSGEKWGYGNGTR